MTSNLLDFDASAFCDHLWEKAPGIDLLNPGRYVVTHFECRRCKARAKEGWQLPKYGELPKQVRAT